MCAPRVVLLVAPCPGPTSGGLVRPSCEHGELRLEERRNSSVMFWDDSSYEPLSGKLAAAN